MEKCVSCYIEKDPGLILKIPSLPKPIYKNGFWKHSTYDYKIKYYSICYSCIEYQRKFPPPTLDLPFSAIARNSMGKELNDEMIELYRSEKTKYYKKLRKKYKN